MLPNEPPTDERFDDRRLHELADAVRAASDDLAQPDFARLVQAARSDPALRTALSRSRRLDLSISEALCELPVPPGSIDRLLAAMAEARASAALHNAPAVAVEPAGLTSARAESPRRRRLGATTAGLVTTAAVLVFAYLTWRPSQTTLTLEEIFNQDSVVSADAAAAVWRPLADAPARYPVSGALVVSPVAWRPIDRLLGRRGGAAYQLRAGQARATLYVIDEAAAHGAPRLVDMHAAPPRQPYQTQGKSMAAWASGGVAYLLIVEGGAAEYRAFVAPAGQLAYGGPLPSFSETWFSSYDC